MFRVNLVQFLWKIALFHGCVVVWFSSLILPRSKCFCFGWQSCSMFFSRLIVSSHCLVVSRWCEGRRSVFGSGFYSLLPGRLAHIPVRWLAQRGVHPKPRAPLVQPLFLSVGFIFLFRRRAGRWQILPRQLRFSRLLVPQCWVSSTDMETTANLALVNSLHRLVLYWAAAGSRCSTLALFHSLLLIFPSWLEHHASGSMPADLSSSWVRARLHIGFCPCRWFGNCGYPRCHTWFLSQNRILIICVPWNQVYTHTAQKMDTE
jgi:hypothetical protein